LKQVAVTYSNMDALENVGCEIHAKNERQLRREEKEKIREET
jgi:hypothetical protein